jgi:hypothetical protein
MDCWVSRRYFTCPPETLMGDLQIGGVSPSTLCQSSSQGASSRVLSTSASWSSTYRYARPPKRDLHGVLAICTDKQILPDHCIEALREGIQCWGPTTFVPAVFDPALGHHYANSDQVHTCRDISVAREFSTERQRGGKLWVPYPDQRIPQ